MRPVINDMADSSEETEQAKKSTSNYGLLALSVKLVKLAKVVKVIKIALFMGAGVIYTYAYGLPFAIVLTTCLTVHECGHLWAMRRSGFPIRGFYMIPFAGAMIVPERSFRSRGEEFFVATMGPAAGLIISLLCGLLFMLTGQPFWSHLALFNTVLNGFNLLPVNPLDGGRMSKSIIFSATSKLDTAFSFFTTSMLLLFFGFLLSRLLHAHSWWETFVDIFNACLWGMIIVVSLIEMFDEKEKEKSRLMPRMLAKDSWCAAAIYIGVIAGFATATAMTWADPSVREVFKLIIHS